MKLRMLHAHPLASVILAFSHALAADQPITTPCELDAAQAARESVFYGQVNRTQAAGILERIITEGQCHPILNKYLGVDPRILAEVHADQIALRFRTFDQFSQSPVQWSRLGSRMADFNVKWQEVSEFSAFDMPEEAETAWWALELSAEKEGATTLIPLNIRPGGYSKDDALLMVSILTGREAPSKTLDRTIPPPKIRPAKSAPMQKKPGSEPTGVPDTQPEKATREEENPLPIETPSPTPGPAPYSAIQPYSPTDLRQKLESLKLLHDDGLIDSKVYLEKQRELLDQL
ncbi:MAG: hypothetical protein PHP44_09530 [Kiritimatiellae bacterium]|nr:hypothetical protein [Kiritimatiellia bacterium]MDD4736334.1 hypothetical protein [Kiritimatiellia bacterium]